MANQLDLISECNNNKVDIGLKKSNEAKTSSWARTAQIKKTLKKKNNSLSNLYKHDNYNTNKSQDS